MEICYLLHPGGVFVCLGPAAVELITLFTHFSIDHVVCREDAEAFEEHFVGEAFLEASASVLHKGVEQSEGAELAMGVAIFA